MMKVVVKIAVGVLLGLTIRAMLAMAITVWLTPASMKDVRTSIVVT